MYNLYSSNNSINLDDEAVEDIVEDLNDAFVKDPWFRNGRCFSKLEVERIKKHIENNGSSINRTFFDFIKKNNTFVVSYKND